MFTPLVASLLIFVYFLPLPSHRGCRRRSSDRGPPLLLSGWTPRWSRCGVGRVGIFIYFLPLPSHRGCRRRSSDRGPPLLLSGRTPRWSRCGVGSVGIFIYFLPLPSHRGCRRRSGVRGPPLLLSGWIPRWSRCGVGILKGGCGLGRSCFISFLFPFASRVPQAIKRSRSIVAASGVDS